MVMCGIVMVGKLIQDALHGRRRAIRASTTDIQVSWKWYDQSQGIVEWTFTNTGKEVESAILVRGVGLNNQCLEPYIFGEAFFPLYHYDFNVPFTTAVQPLTDNGVENNAPPLGVLSLPNGQTTVGFIFTLSPGQSWSMLEGGFANTAGPCNATMYPATPVSSTPSCYSISYNVVMQCMQYNLQAGTNYPCPPNPFQVNSILWNVPQVPILFQDNITPCNSGNGCGGGGGGGGFWSCLMNCFVNTLIRRPKARVKCPS